jgi:hypothetical protein
MLKENNYKELEYTLKRLFEKHYKNSRSTLTKESVIKEFSGSKHFVSEQTISEINKILSVNRFKFKRKNRDTIVTDSDYSNNYKIVIGFNEHDLTNDLNTIIIKLKENKVEFGLEISLLKKRSNVGIKLYEGTDIKKVSSIIRNNIFHDHLQENIPYIPSINNIGVILDKYSDALPFEEMMNEYMYNHLEFVIKRGKIELCSPDFIIKSLENNIGNKDSLRKRLILNNLKAVRDFSNKEIPYVKQR